MEIEICIDVPDLAAGEAFYTRAFGFEVIGHPFPNVVTLSAGDVTIALLQKDEGSKAAGSAAAGRTYRRHWTPVHLDFKVPDIHAALKQAVAAGAVQESDIISDGPQTLVTCSDPFGHGFCFLGPPDS